jgi:hypothetical protein
VSSLSLGKVRPSLSGDSERDLEAGGIGSSALVVKGRNREKRNLVVHKLLIVLVGILLEVIS